MAAPAPQGESGEPQPDAAECEQRDLTISVSEHGLRLDKTLALLVPEFSRSYLQQLLEQGAVQLDGRVGVKPAHKVRAGDLLRVQMRPTEQSQAFHPEPIPIDVVHEDEHLLVINKPAGLICW